MAVSADDGVIHDGQVSGVIRSAGPASPRLAADLSVIVFCDAPEHNGEHSGDSDEDSDCHQDTFEHLSSLSSCVASILSQGSDIGREVRPTPRPRTE